MELDLAWLLALVVVLFFVVLAYTMYAHLKESGQWNDEADLESMRSQAKTVQAGIFQEIMKAISKNFPIALDRIKSQCYNRIYIIPPRGVVIGDDVAME